MKFKKLLSISASILLATSLLTGCSSNKEKAKKLSVAIVLGEGSINDQSFNQSTWEGLQKAKEDFGVDIKYLESKQKSDYVQNIETFVDQDIDLIVGVGYQLEDPIKEMAESYPEQKFGLIDATYKNIPKNVVPVVFKEEEGAYLAGMIAAKMTKTDNVGFIGGMTTPSIEKYHYGFKYGAVSTNKDVKIQEQYANSFSDQAKGKSIAKQMHAAGADIILAAAGDTGTGSIEAARENKKYAIGVDRDQSYLAPENVITSVLKKLNVASYNLSKELVDGKFEGGVQKVYGLKEGAIGIPENTSKHVPQDIIDYVNKQAELVKNGKVIVPRTQDEFNGAK
ncbi:BMP family ABC transporter substrate-binding protein [Romboutsia maritimum]|uniref:BMP family ABC transporter substrate-binding protein n=1 Tax=Romboutsia maritimum TaxID=2020948 RepID=A0A371IWN5_9FIRM|nr:BMP family ABC transporter substrate-binding protein [Romboutsia maritimum]RDY24891.1 BMP family ABC transporter substrate-binding protein [Romboutsia maritimum]